MPLKFQIILYGNSFFLTDYSQNYSLTIQPLLIMFMIASHNKIKKLYRYDKSYIIASNVVCRYTLALQMLLCSPAMTVLVGPQSRLKPIMHLLAILSRNFFKFIYCSQNY